MADLRISQENEKDVTTEEMIAEILIEETIVIAVIIVTETTEIDEIEIVTIAIEEMIEIGIDTGVIDQEMIGTEEEIGDGQEPDQSKEKEQRKRFRRWRVKHLKNVVQ